MKIGSTDINDIKIGTTTINKVLRGGVLLYEKGPNGSPSLLTLTAISDTQINLAWTNDSTNEDGISIERSTDNITYTEIHITASGVSTYQNTGLTENTTYYYKVRAVKGTKYSSYSNISNAVTLIFYWGLPDSIEITAGKSITIYGDSLINIPIENELIVEYTCDIGTQNGNNYIINSEIIGIHNLDIIFKNYGVIFIEKTIALNVSQSIGSDPKKLMMIGDSLIYLGNESIASGLSEYLPNSTLTLIGTLGSIVKHEGHPGFGYISLLGVSSPFVKDGVLNISAYFTDNEIDIPDYVLLRLGVNDMYGHCDDDLTDSIMNQILGYAQTFIDAFLNWNASVKIIIGLSTICENSGAGWYANYKLTPQYSQEKYIEIVHKFWKGIIDYFETYSTRVFISTESIYLDRNDGYPKINGIHTNGVHPSDSGYVELGRGIAMYLNKIMLDEANYDITLVSSWENDYAKLEWNDKTGGVAQYEIYENKNNEGYILVYTTLAGVITYNNYTYHHASMKFKVRAKIDGWYSEYSNESSLTTPLVIKSDQSILGSIVFNLNVVSGKTINVNWGDGTSNNYTGINAVSKTFSIEKNPYYITFSGDLDSILLFRFVTQTKIYGDLTKWNLPTSILTFVFSETPFSGSIVNIPQGINYYYANSSSVDSTFITLRSSVLGFVVSSCVITSLPIGDFSGIDATVGYIANNNSISSAKLDEFLLALYNHYSQHLPSKNAKYTLNGTGMGHPSVTGLGYRTAIYDIFSGVGKTITILVN